jgi:hypothetical protein
VIVGMLSGGQHPEVYASAGVVRPGVLSMNLSMNSLPRMPL